MEKWETIYFDILCRLHDVCRSIGADMWLAGPAALGAYRDGRLTDSGVDVLVDAKHAVRLAEALKAASDDSFGCESMLSNSRYPRIEIRAFDPRTTDCDTSEFFRIDNNCMYVTVHFLQRPADKKSLKNRIERKLFSSLSGNAGYYKHMAQAAEGAGTVNANGCSFNGRLFKEKTSVQLYGREFSIPKKSGEYFTAQFGPGWEYLEPAKFSPDSKHFRSSEKSWNKISRVVTYEEISSYEKLLGEYRRESADVRKYNKEIDKVYRATDCSFDKICLYKDLAPREDELAAMLEAGELDALEAELMPYLKGLKKYLDLGLDLYLDDRLTEISDSLLRQKGRTAFADAVLRQIPADREPVTLTDHHGQPLKEIPEKHGEAGKDEKLSPAQQRLLDLMKRVDAFLRENGIEYFLFGGSLLGAIRHDGFIPWDDDMDIVMTRDNYYKLVSLSDDLPWDDIAFDCFEKNPRFERPFGMFTLLTDTRFVKTRVFMGGAGMGTGIDVFVMDYVPREHLDEYIKNSLLYQEMQTDSFINNGRIADYKDEYFACKEREAAEGKAAEMERLRDELEKYGDEKADDLRVVRLWFNRPRIYEPGMMAEPQLHKFEDTEFTVPARAVECLEMQYGQTWNVVPEEGHRDEHAFKIDYDVSANNFYRLLDRRTDWDRVFEVLRERKKKRISLLDKTNKLDVFRKILAGAADQ